MNQEARIVTVDETNVDELRECFESDAEFERFRAGEDYTMGLAGVTDSEYNRHYDQMVEAIRELGTHTAVIWITAYGCVNLEADRERLDVSFCLEKPLRIGEIRQAALEALEIPSKDL